MLTQQPVDSSGEARSMPFVKLPAGDAARNLDGTKRQDCAIDGCRVNVDIREFSSALLRRNIEVHHTRGQSLPASALLHDRAAPVPALVVSPRNENEVVETLKAFKKLNLYGRVTLSVKSGGHGHFNGASCTGVMVNLSAMTRRRVEENILYLEPGCLLAGTIDILAKNKKAVPHGECFGVGAGGHFLTAGWDLVLARRYGLGCQYIAGGRIVLWDGTVLEVDEDHPQLLYAMRGGAAAGAGVVTEIQLRLIDEPAQATWKFTRIDKTQLETCVLTKAFEKSFGLPRDISVSFRFHFEPDQIEPVCTFNIVSLLTAEETISTIEAHLGQDISRMVKDISQWHQKRLLDLRLVAASDGVRDNPTSLAEVTQESLHRHPLSYWTEGATKRGMERSYLTSISHWVMPKCESMFNDLYQAFEEVQDHPARERMYAVVVLGAGRMNDLQDQCAMPLGEALARFELHWDDDAKDREWSEKFTATISDILRSKEDGRPGRPYRGDIWIKGQDRDVKLDNILRAYDRRFA